jgi:hypothetical protein
MAIRTKIGELGDEFVVVAGQIKVVGAGGGTLATLTDVDLAGLVDQDFIRYDVVGGKWLPAAAPSARAFFMRLM